MYKCKYFNKKLITLILPNVYEYGNSILEIIILEFSYIRKFFNPKIIDSFFIEWYNN